MNKRIIGIIIVCMFFWTNFVPSISNDKNTSGSWGNTNCIYRKKIIATFTVILPPGGVIVYNPYKDINFTTVRHYKANLHTHTTLSDGGSLPATVIYHYCNNGNYDILEITDHNTNTWPWSNWITGYTPYYESESSAYFPTLGSGVLAISGNEASGTWPLGHDHNSLLNDYAGNGINPATSLQYIQNNNGLSFFHHPGRYGYSVKWYNNWFDTYNISIGMEVFNQGDRYPNDIIKWDSINRQRAPDDLIWGFSDDDMHSLSSQSFRNFQHFLMNNLTEVEFRNAMINGAFYFSYEPNGANSASPTYGQADTPKLTNVIISGDIITITGEDYTSIQWYNQTTNVVGTGTSINLSSLNYTKFVRAVLININGSTYTQPFGFEVLNQQPNKPLINGNINGKPDTEYNYQFFSTDLDKDQICMYVYWGDGGMDFIDFYKFCINVTLQHTWVEKGIYTIKAKVMDEHGVWSDWGILTVIMLKSKTINIELFLQKLFQSFPFFEKILKQ